MYTTFHNNKLIDLSKGRKHDFNNNKLIDLDKGIKHDFNKTFIKYTVLNIILYGKTDTQMRRGHDGEDVSYNNDDEVVVNYYDDYDKGSGDCSLHKV